MFLSGTSIRLRQIFPDQHTKEGLFKKINRIPDRTSGGNSFLVDVEIKNSCSSFPSSSSSSSSAWRGVEGGGARLLPPLLSEQSWGVHSHQAFLLFCLAVGPGDVSLQWHSNGRRLETPVTEYRHALCAGDVLVSSWVREEPLSKDTQYQCSAVSGAGNDTSKIDLRLSSRDEADTVSEELNQWRAALTEHERHFNNWKKLWESCDGQDVL